MKRNGFDGPWNPICPECGGYMHANHKPDCPTVLHRQRENEKLAVLHAKLLADPNWCKR